MSGFSGGGVGGQARRHKPGTAILSRRQRHPTRSGSDGRFTYNLPPYSGTMAHEQHFLPSQPQEDSTLAEEFGNRHRVARSQKPNHRTILDSAFDATEHFDMNEELSLDDELDTSLPPYMNTGGTAFDVPFLEDRVKVPKTLRFSPLKMKNWTGWEARFQIENKTNLNITYCVLTSPGSSFNVQPEIGWISPGSSTTTVGIRTEKPFSHFCKDFVIVFVAPVYFRRQLAQEKLDVLWRALGSTFFPFERVEEHCIEHIVAADDRSLDDYCMIERVMLGGWQRKKLKLHKVDLDEVSEARFKEVWDVGEENFELQLKCQLREIKRSFRRIRAKAEMDADKSFAIRAGVFIMLALLLMTLRIHWEYVSTPLTIGLFKVTGALHGYVPPEPEPAGWWDYTHGILTSLLSSLGSFFGMQPEQNAM